MAVDSQIITYVGMAGNLAVTAFLVGVVYGRLTSKIAATSKDIAEVKVATSKEIRDVKVATSKEIGEVKAAVESVNKKLTTPEGDPLLMSYKAHDHICMRANEIISAELRHVSEAIVAHSAAVRTCSEQVSQLAVAVAVLEEKVEK